MSGSAAGWSDVPATEGPAPGTFSEDNPRYRIEARLGEGGMGEVYRAWDAWLQRHVALKRVHSRHRHDALRERLLREARVTAQLDHPAIVPVLDVGDLPDGALFYTMRLIEGRTLAETAPEQSEAQRLRHLRDAVRAVAHAHLHGIIHRDLKPDNIMVGQLGETSVVDWGLARHEAQTDLPLPAGASSPRLTRVGDVLGTESYMSPEASQGQASRASDVFALGATMVEVLTGNKGESADAWRVHSAQIADPVLRAIVQRALADIGERYEDARGLLDDLGAWVDNRPVGSYTYSPLEAVRLWAKRYRWPLRVAGAVAVTGIAVVALAGARIIHERDRALTAEAMADKARIAADDALARSLTRQAVDAMTRRNIAAAEVLATRALELEEIPRARGVLMAAAAVDPRFEANPRKCPGDLIAGTVGWACVQGDTLFPDDETGLAMPHANLHEPASDGGVWFSDSLHTGLFHGGTTQFSVTTFGTALDSDGDTALKAQRDALTLLRTDGRNQSFDICVGSVARTPPTLRDETSAVLCADGRIERLHLSGERSALPAATLVDTDRIADLVLSADGYWITRGSALEQLDAQGALVQRFDLPLGTLGSVQTDHSDRWALVRGATETAVVDLHDGSVLLALPKLYLRPVMGRDGLVRTSGDYAASFDPRDLRATMNRPTGISSIDATPDGRVAAVYGAGDVVIWDGLRSEVISERRLGNLRIAKSVSFGHDNTTVWASQLDVNRPFLVDATTAELLTTPAHGDEACKRLFTLADGAAWCASYNASGTPLYRIDEPTERPAPFATAIDIGQSGPGAAVFVDTEGALLLFRPDEPYRELPARPGTTRVTANHDGSLIAASNGSEVQLLDGDGLLLASLPGTPPEVLDLALSADGRWLAASDRSHVYVWDVPARTLVAELPPLHGDRVGAIDLSDHHLFTSGWDGVIRRWSLAPLTQTPSVAQAESRWGVQLADLVD